MRKLIRKLVIAVIVMCVITHIVNIVAYTKFYYYTSNDSRDVKKVASGVFKKEHRINIDGDNEVDVVIQSKNYGVSKVECNDIDLKVYIEKFLTSIDSRDCIVVKSDFSAQSMDKIKVIISEHYENVSKGYADKLAYEKTKDIAYDVANGNIDGSTVSDINEIFSATTLRELLIEMTEAEVERLHSTIENGIDSSLEKYESNEIYKLAKKAITKIYNITGVVIEYGCSEFDLLQIETAEILK